MRQTWSLSVPVSISTHSLCMEPVHGTCADPYKPSTKWHTAQQRHCGTVARGRNGPKKQDLIRNVKPGLAV